MSDGWGLGPTCHGDRAQRGAVGRNLADGEVGSGRHGHHWTQGDHTKLTEGFAPAIGHGKAVVGDGRRRCSSDLGEEGAMAANRLGERRGKRLRDSAKLAR